MTILYCYKLAFFFFYQFYDSIQYMDHIVIFKLFISKYLKCSLIG